MLPRVPAAVLAAAATACSFTGGYDGTRYQCGEGDRCPPGTTCVDGYCVTGVDPIDASVPDGPPIDGETPTARCGTIELLQDDFGTAGDGPYWYPFADTGATVTESGGHLVVQLGDGTAADEYAGYVSAFRYDLTGAAISSRVTEVGGQVTILEVRDPTGGRAQLVGEDGMLFASVYQTGSDGPRTAIPYDAGEHGYWRFREDGGRLYWETSPDRLAWTAFHDEPAPIDVQHVHGVLAAGGLVAGGDQARFDDVNADAPASLAYCAAAELVDGFDDAPLEPIWDNWTASNCALGEVNGKLQMAFTGSGTGFCGVGSRHLFDLRDSALVVDATELPSSPGFVSYVTASIPGDDATRIGLSLEDGTIYASQAVDDVEVVGASITYMPALHRYWRLRGAAGRFYLELSGDGAAWSTLLAGDLVIDLSRVFVALGAGRYATGDGTSLLVRWGGVNAP